jgi:type I restriction enzyme S subunit
MIHDLKPYPAYKDSGVAWLGKVPEHWDVFPALAAYRPKLIRNTGAIEKTVLSLSYGRIIIKPQEKLRGLVPESFETYQVVDPGDIILRTTDLQNDQTSLRVGYSKYRGIITAAYMCLETTSRLSNEFGYQLLNSYDLLKLFYGLGTGLRQNLEFSHIKHVPVLVPPRGEQSAIVRFLDYVDRRTRRYIRAKHMIALLNEHKQAIIQRAVTQGLDMDDATQSLGSAPDFAINARWRTGRLWGAARIRSEKGRPNLDLLSVFLGRGVIPYGEGGGQVHKPSFDLASYQVVHPGDLVLNNQQAWRGSVGISACLGIISPAYAVLALDPKLNSRFANYLFKSHVMIAQFVTSSKGVGDIQRDIHFAWLKNAKVPTPPLREQERIADHLDRELSELERHLSMYSREVALLREYRTRLIADVVTGKLDVREVAARLPEEAEEAELIDDRDACGERGEETEATGLDADAEEAEA